MSYHDHNDHQYAKNLLAGAPAASKAFLAFGQEALSGAGKVIPRKYTELMAVAVALTTQCAHCIEAHTSRSCTWCLRARPDGRPPAPRQLDHASQRALSPRTG